MKIRQECPVKVVAREVTLEGDLCIPEGATGIVIFAHGSGSSRLSPRNQYVGQQLRKAGLATLLFDLLTREEERRDMFTGYLRFDIKLLGERLIGVTDWLVKRPEAEGLSVGYFGASTGAAAALVAAAARPDVVRAVVSRGGRPDLAGMALAKVKAPTLLIVGGHDYEVISLNQEACARLTGEKRLVVVPGATHLFEEPGTMEAVARLASTWFTEHLARAAPSGANP